MAQDILPIQGSSVPCERVFSSAKETTTPRRNRLAPDTMEACQMLKYHIKAREGEGLNFTQHMSIAAVEAEIEQQELYRIRLPAEIREYRLLFNSQSG